LACWYARGGRRLASTPGGGGAAPAASGGRAGSDAAHFLAAGAALAAFFFFAILRGGEGGRIGVGLADGRGARLNGGPRQEPRQGHRSGATQLLEPEGTSRCMGGGLWRAGTHAEGVGWRRRRTLGGARAPRAAGGRAAMLLTSWPPAPPWRPSSSSPSCAVVKEGGVALDGADGRGARWDGGPRQDSRPEHRSGATQPWEPKGTWRCMGVAFGVRVRTRRASAGADAGRRGGTPAASGGRAGSEAAHFLAAGLAAAFFFFAILRGGEGGRIGFG